MVHGLDAQLPFFFISICPLFSPLFISGSTT